MIFTSPDILVWKVLATQYLVYSTHQLLKASSRSIVPRVPHLLPSMDLRLLINDMPSEDHVRAQATSKERAKLQVDLSHKMFRSGSVASISNNLPPTPVSPTMLVAPQEEQVCTSTPAASQYSLEKTSTPVASAPALFRSILAPPVPSLLPSPAAVTSIVTPALTLSTETYPTLAPIRPPCANALPFTPFSQLKGPELPLVEVGTGTGRIPTPFSPQNLRSQTFPSVSTHRPVIVLVPAEMRAQQVEPVTARVPCGVPSPGITAPPTGALYRPSSESASNTHQIVSNAGASSYQMPRVHAPWDQVVPISVPCMCVPSSQRAETTLESPTIAKQEERAANPAYGSSQQPSSNSQTPQIGSQCGHSMAPPFQTITVSQPQSPEVSTRPLPHIPIIAVKSSVSTSKTKSRRSQPDISLNEQILLHTKAVSETQEPDLRARRFKCGRCPRAFFRKSDLSRHEHIHTGVKPNACHICGKKFIQRSALGVHIRVHTGEKPHRCPFCDRPFSDSSSLARHRRIHLRKAHMKGISDEVALANALVERAKRAEITRRAVNMQQTAEFTDRATLGQ